MTLHSALSTMAGVEIAAATLIIILFLIGFGIDESDDVWALGLSYVILVGPPLAAFMLNKSSAIYRSILASVLVAVWLTLAWWLVAYA